MSKSTDNSYSQVHSNEVLGIININKGNLSSNPTWSQIRVSNKGQPKQFHTKKLHSLK